MVTSGLRLTLSASGLQVQFMLGYAMAGQSLQFVIIPRTRLVIPANCLGVTVAADGACPVVKCGRQLNIRLPSDRAAVLRAVPQIYRLLACQRKFLREEHGQMLEYPSGTTIHVSPPLVHKVVDLSKQPFLGNVDRLQLLRKVYADLTRRACTRVPILPEERSGHPGPHLRTTAAYAVTTRPYGATQLALSDLSAEQLVTMFTHVLEGLVELRNCTPSVGHSDIRFANMWQVGGGDWVLGDLETVMPLGVRYEPTSDPSSSFHGLPRTAWGPNLEALPGGVFTHHSDLYAVGACMDDAQRACSRFAVQSLVADLKAARCANAEEAIQRLGAFTDASACNV